MFYYKRVTNTSSFGLFIEDIHGSMSSSMIFRFILFCCLTLLHISGANFALDDGIDCQPADFLYQYTPCDQTGQRWRYAVPKSHQLLCKNTPPPTPGVNCSFSCPSGSYLKVETQQCQLCPAGTFSLGDRVRYEQFSKLPTGFSVENFPDEDQHFLHSEGYNSEDDSDRRSQGIQEQCSNSLGWVIQNGELRYVPTPCVSRLSISLNFIKDGFIEFHYKMPKNSRGLIPMLQVRNAQCQSYGNIRSLFFHAIRHQLAPTSRNKIPDRSSGDDWDVAADGSADYRVRRLRIRAGQNLVTWTVATNRETTTFADVINVPKVDISGLGFAPLCSKCPPGTYSVGRGAQECQSCAPLTFSARWSSSACDRCASDEYSGPRADRCIRRPKCQSSDFYPVRNPSCKNGTISVTNAMVQPTVCREGHLSSPTGSTEPCPRCSLGMFRDKTTGICQRCNAAQNEFAKSDGTGCEKCAADSIPEHGLFFTRWDTLPAELTTDCEYFVSDVRERCTIAPAWVLLGDRIESTQARARGVALELNLNIEAGFYCPLQASSTSKKKGGQRRENPVAQVSIELEMHCADESCQFYFVQEYDEVNAAESSLRESHSRRRQQNAQQHPSASSTLAMLASLNGTQSRTIWRFPIFDTRPTRFVLVFTRSGAGLAEDIYSDRAAIYSLNVTNVGNAHVKQLGGTAFRCVRCPHKDSVTGKCQPCPTGHFFDRKINQCVKCPSGTALLNYTAFTSENPANACVPCPTHFSSSEDGSECLFSGRFDLNSTDNETLRFDISPLRDHTLTANGIQMFAREGSVYHHSFNVSLFEESPVKCRDSFDTSATGGSSPTLARSAAQIPDDIDSLDDNALFCRSTAIPASSFEMEKPLTGLANGTSKNAVRGDLYLSSTVLAKKVAAITLDRRFGDFHLSNDQLEYEDRLSDSNRPLDVHFFFEPSAIKVPTCPNGLIGVITVRCEPTAVQNPLVRLSRKCPDGTCDGCLYHVIVESTYACPICRPEDFREIRGECVDSKQKIHFIPSKHCILSGAQTREHISNCSTMSGNLRFALVAAVLLIVCLVVVIFVIYERNKSLEHRYMRLIEGKETDQLNSCALDESDDEDEEEISSLERTRVFFGKKKKTNYSAELSKNARGNAKSGEETTEFLSDSSD